MLTTRVCWVFVVFLLSGCSQNEDSPDIIYVDPVFKVDVPAPTADKPQSKIWYAKGVWRAVLPTSAGPSIWERGANGWRENMNFNISLKGFPGQADVCHWEGKAMAVLVGDCKLNVIGFSAETRSDTLLVSTLPIPEGCSSIETATIARDGTGTWWVASDIDTSVAVWSSGDGKEWEGPYILTEDINGDDICVIATTSRQVSVIWSNQNSDGVFEAVHYNNDSAKVWSAPVTVEQGNKTADDHLNTTLLEDDTLVLISKNSLDQIDSPQFVLRLRRVSGKWENIPLVNLTTSEMPTRPVVINTFEGTVIAAYAVKNVDSKDYHISFSLIEQRENKWRARERLRVKAKDNSTVNNVTVSKEPFPVDGSWIMLFSDVEGNVYEMDLRKHRYLFEHGGKDNF